MRTKKINSLCMKKLTHCMASPKFLNMHCLTVQRDSAYVCVCMFKGHNTQSIKVFNCPSSTHQLHAYENLYRHSPKLSYQSEDNIKGLESRLVYFCETV